MIRQLDSQDRAACETLLFQKPAENLFIISDIENFGFEEDFQTLWGDWNAEGELSAVLLKYHSNYICYGDGPFDGKGFASIINQDPDFRELSGLEEMTNEILPFIARRKKHSRQLYYAKMDQLVPSPSPDGGECVQLATVKDIPSIARLFDEIDDFEESENREGSLKVGMESKSARTYFIRKGGKLVSSASTTAENSASAMVVGVCTHPDHTKKGYASQCMERLCEELINEGKSLCLFYDNPDAGRIYKRLGFLDIGFWTMHIYEPQEVGIV
ncbi:GNAT family N-acetyltransferase [Halobacillus salinus]|uniref:GNAT family N-acetyltransferase n=1 Tax=Halobacillus salinus TaxID=192814 RepID=A0A4Z0H0R9_9BACI|nr:GNAT family N-acetyltransferase [Halobacillus salinus]TGB04003.1 GNAT family N-acetyltransferase [Halobacillus salinus]